MASLNARPIAKATALAAVAATLALATVAACTVGLASTLRPSPTTEPILTVEVSSAWRKSPTPGPSPTPFPDRDVDTGRVVRLTRSDDTETNPTWSPDGDQVAFECHDDAWVRDFLDNSLAPIDGREVANRQIHYYHIPLSICVVNSDGSGVFQLTDDGGGDDWSPAWSPDGSGIAFVSDRDELDSIYLINPDGSGLRRITDYVSVEEGPVWSPDGSRMAFTSNGVLERQRDIFVIYADGTGLSQITDDGFTEEGLTWSPDGTKIAFAASRDGRDDAVHIFTVNTDGSDVTQITDRPGYHSEPTWSPDGNRIAFISGGEDIWGLSVMNSDGSEPALLYPSILNDQLTSWSNVESPAWSPDGKTIAFAAQPWNGGSSPDLELYMINSDGSRLKRLTYRAGDDSNPTWSPDGSRLAFESRLRPDRRCCMNPEIYVLVDFEPNQLPLTDNAHSDLVPAWSPDGNRIAFVSDLDGDFDIYISNADGSGTRQLTANDNTDSRPAWSPDGNRIAFVSDQDGDEDLYVINADGSGIKQLTNNDHPDSRPVWSPEGSHIAYVSVHNGLHADIFVMNADGSNVVQLTTYDDTETSHYNGAPSWSPDGIRIAFVSAVHGRYQRHVMNSDGTQTVTADVENCPSYEASSWSADSTRIAFACNNSRIHLFNPSDRTETSAKACSADNWPALSTSWSPDGGHIVFTCTALTSDRRVHKINLDDGTVTRYTIEGCWPYYPAWSPDESKMAILSYLDRVYDLCVAEPEPVP